MIIRKMIKNKWLELGLVMGLILSVALVSSIPIYTDAILQRMLYQDLQNKQIESGQFSGVHWSTIYMNKDSSLDDREKRIERTDRYMNSTKSKYSLPIIHYVRRRSTKRYEFIPNDPQKLDPSVNRTAEISSMSGLQENIQLIEGRLPSKEPIDGVYEALIFSSVPAKLSIVLNNEIKISNEEIGEEIIIKPVGMISPQEGNELYFYNKSIPNYNRTLFIDFNLFEKEFIIDKKVPVQTAHWYMPMDYSEINIDHIQRFMETNRATETFLANTFDFYNIESPILSTIGSYHEREQRLRTLMWSLNVPVMIMLAFYLFMVSNLIINRQKTEIAVIRSRGASRFQVMMSFTFEGIMLGLVAFITGPYLGVLLTKVLGASNGFLQFVQRSALQVNIGEEVYNYAFVAVVCSLMMTLIPAFIATKTTIVGHKQQKAQNRSFWHKYFLDVIFLTVSIYGLSTFYRKLNDLQQMGLDAIHFRIDPMLFLIPALFILGMGLFILRIYPWLIRLIYWIGRKWWPPSLYSTLIQVGRSNHQYQFIMVFLAITMATGIFSASAARTLNENMEKQIYYNNGADIVLDVRWENNDRPPSRSGSEEEVERPQRIQYTEPPFVKLSQLPGVESAAKVFMKPDASFKSGSEKGTVTLMGIDTDEFAQSSWMVDGLLDHHYYQYLNLIAPNSSAVLISRTMADQKGIREGDTIQMTWGEFPMKSFIVYAIVDFFPTFNPNPQLNSDGQGGSSAPMLVVGHLQYIQNQFALEPYKVWIKLTPDASRQAFYDALTENNISVTHIDDTRKEIIHAKNDPFQLAINGVMTLGFMISIIISFCGYLLYWILSLMSRVLQLGIFRAMGISLKQIIGMLVVEQLLTSGAAILIGVLTGHVTSRLFVPLFQMSFDTASWVPPFEVAFETSDTIKLYFIVSLMIILGLVILGYMVSRIKIHQAVKLGED